MNDLQKRIPPPAPPAAQPAVLHEEPQTGGSFTRNVDTGEISKNDLAPVDKTEQE